MKQSTYKVPDGKLIKVKLWVDDDFITKIVITGDFFLHPETTLEHIESNLIGVQLNQQKLIHTIERIIKDKHATLIGASASDFCHAILIAE